jgi:hypothetical protein
MNWLKRYPWAISAFAEVYCLGFLFLDMVMGWWRSALFIAPPLALNSWVLWHYYLRSWARRVRSSRRKPEGP